METTRPLRVYIETTVWNFPFADDAPERRDITRRFFEEVRAGRYEVYISTTVAEEIGRAPEPRRSQLQSLVDEIAPAVLEPSEEALALAREYIASGAVPESHRNDATHIAVAVLENMDLLVSWNFQHIVRVSTRRVVSATSRMAGYREIEICTPEEVIDDNT